MALTNTGSEVSSLRGRQSAAILVVSLPVIAAAGPKRSAAPDLAKHKFYVWLNNYHWVPLTVLGGLLYAIGGLPLFLWAGCLRVVVGLHSTWLVNSATHLWGRRRFETRDDSRNSWWVALLTFGEGWHNNHHAHPTSARHGLAWYELDISWITLKAMKFLGIAKNIRVAKISNPLEEREAA